MSCIDVTVLVVQRDFSQMWNAPSGCRHMLKLPLMLNAGLKGDLIKPLCLYESATAQSGGEATPKTGASPTDSSDGTACGITACGITDTSMTATSATSAVTAVAKVNLPPTFVGANFCRDELRRLAQETDQRLARPLPSSWHPSHDDGHRYCMPMLLHNTSLFPADMLHVVRKSLRERRLARLLTPYGKATRHSGTH